jgi:hypothetical protein
MIGIIVGIISAVIGALWWWREPVSAGRPGSLLVLMGALAVIAVVLCSCGDPGPTKEDMAGCATHRSPTWGDVIDCKFKKERAARHEEK